MIGSSCFQSTGVQSGLGKKRSRSWQYERMKRTTVTLPDDLAALTRREAERRKTSVSEVVRTALDHELRPGGRREIPWAGLVEDPELAPARELDRELSASWADDIAGDR